ncbi:hypothetical protein [Microbacterium sp. H1-D42]|uniref:hypothetical protein n=1 Tax=Microbacterium sp. H1-D42 TaxID=2925844 RepID=UPI001F536762|nr:hypothetical protein [Microbacterium sp. H1-D42]UNK69724.1 hypothetical protein MNR00_11135 [Microbacterium sp. H1-D42]
MRIVAIMSSGQENPALAELAAQAEVIRVRPASKNAGTPEHPLTLPSQGPVARRIERLAWGSALGRNLIRITPLDRSRRLWSAARRDPVLRDLVREADVVVALDRDAILTVWKLSRMRELGVSWDAVYGGTAALFALNNRG